MAADVDDRGLVLADRHRIAVLHHAVDGRDALARYVAAYPAGERLVLPDAAGERILAETAARFGEQQEKLISQPSADDSPLSSIRQEN